MFHMSNTEILKATYVQSVMRHKINWGPVVIRLGVKQHLTLQTKNPAELWLVQNLEIHAQICLRDWRFYLFHVNKNTHFH
jgi:hypothetical protein